MSEQTKTRQRPADVYFFATCVVDQFFPGAGMDAITLLERGDLALAAAYIGGSVLLSLAGLTLGLWAVRVVA